MKLHRVEISESAEPGVVDQYPDLRPVLGKAALKRGIAVIVGQVKRHGDDFLSGISVGERPQPLLSAGDRPDLVDVGAAVRHALYVLLAESRRGSCDYCDFHSGVSFPGHPV